MADDRNIIGGRELDAMLQSLAPKIEKNIMRSALRAGAAVIAKEVKANAPVGPTSSENARLYGGYAGALRDSVRVSVKVEKGGRILAAVKVGGKGKKGADAFYAHMVEFGTKPHLIKPQNARALSIGGAPLAAVMHPGARPRPFVRPAFAHKTQEAIEAVGAQIRKRLTAEGINTPAPESDQV